MADKPSGGLTGVALWVAIVVIAAWLGMLAWLVQQVGASEVIWSRLLVVLGSMEAVAFGAAGALFGVQVQRQRVDDAKQRADKSDKIAADNHEAASNGRALAALVKAQAGGGGGVKVERFVAGSGAADSGADEPASLALAKALFPG